MIMDNTETLINLSLLSFAGLAFVALLVSLEILKDETRCKLLESLKESPWLAVLVFGLDNQLGQGGCDE